MLVQPLGNPSTNGITVWIIAMDDRNVNDPRMAKSTEWMKLRKNMRGKGRREVALFALPCILRGTLRLG